MKQRNIDIDFFARFSFPRSLQTNSRGDLFFSTKKANVEKDRYDTAWWLYRENRLKRLALPKETRAAWWLDDDALVCAMPGDATDKKLERQGLPCVCLNRLPLAPKSKPELLLRLHTPVLRVAALPGGGLVFLAQHSKWVQQALQAAKGDEEKAAAELKKASARTVLEELPFCENGGGYLSGVRQRLYLWDKKKVTPLTGTDVQVEDFCLDEEGKKAHCIVRPMDKVAPKETRLLVVDLSTGRAEDVSPKEGMGMEVFIPLSGGDAFVAGSDMEAYGINQNPSFFRLRAGGGLKVLDASGQYSNWCSVGTDVAMPAGARGFARGGEVFFITTLGHSGQLMSIDVESGQVRQITRTEGAVAELAPAPGEGFYVTAMHGLGGPEVYRVEPDGGETRISSFNTGLTQQYRMAAPRPISFTNKGGTEIEGWVLLPHGLAQGKKCPVILDVHGGPKTVYGEVLFHEMQYWAARGFGVIFCNPTGGDGRGDKFADIRGQYGGIDSEDILQFANEALAAFPQLDGERMGVAGGSYGGFMVNWLIGQTGRFKAAVSQRSISNWGSMALLSDIGYYFEPDQAGTDIWTDPAKVWGNSPLKYADRVKTPTLFIHSDEDYRCPLAEGLQMYTALQLFGVPTKLVLFHGENHELSRSGKPQNRVARLQAITEWFEEYL